MSARWVSHNPSAELPIVAQTLIAHWLPWRYYFVSTVWIDPSDPLELMTKSLKTGEIFKKSYKDIEPGPDLFVTHVYNGDKNIFIKSMDYYFYEREYSNIAEARSGHEETVRLLSQGQLKLKRVSCKLEDLFPK